LGRQAPLEAGGVPRRAAGPLARAFLGDGLGGAGRVGRGRGAAVGGVAAQGRDEVADGRLQFGEAALPRGDVLVTLPAPRTTPATPGDRESNPPSFKLRPAAE